MNNITYILLILLALSAPAMAQDIIQTYNEARDTYFWDGLYQGGGTTLYCNAPFTRDSHTGLHVEHVYRKRPRFGIYYFSRV